MWDSRGYYYDEGTAGGSPPTYTTGDIINIAFDVDAGKIWFGKNNTYNHSGNPANGTNQTTGSTNDLSSIGVTIAGNGENGGTAVYNCGQDSSFVGNKTAQGNTDENGIGDFYYAPPSGFLAICTANLPEPTIGPTSATQADDHFNTVLYSGDGSTQSITGVGFQPDWVWIKERSSTSSHQVYDSSRGVKIALEPNTTEVDRTENNNLTVFGTDGFTVGNSGALNQSSQTYVSWNWKANGGVATATISESGNNPAAVVQANPTAGFSIITYTGTSGTGTIAHGLGAVPKWIIIKNRGDARNWIVYHGANTAAPETDFLILNTNADTADNAEMFSDTAPTSSVFTIGDTNNDGTNEDNDTYVAYCFAEIEGYSKFGNYTGNGNADGTFVYTGFRPAFLIIKRTDVDNNWVIMNNKSSPFNAVDDYFYANVSNTEFTSTERLDMLSNGFKLTKGGSGYLDQNASGGTYIYMAFAEAPFKYANAR